MKDTRTTIAALISCLTSACGGPDSGESVLQLSAYATDLLVIRQGDAWEPIALDADSRAAVPITGPYELVRVCGATRWTRAVLAGPRDDVGELVLDCAARPAEIQLTVTAVGATSARVYIANRAALLQNGQPQASFALRAGTYDLVAVTDGPRKLIVRRALALTGPTTISIDVAAEGDPLIERALQTPNGEVGSATFLSAGGTGASLPRESTRVWLPQASALNADDRLFAGMYLEAQSQRQRRVIEIDPSTMAPITIDLPDPLVTAEFATSGVASARWSAPGDWPWATVTASNVDVGGEPEVMWHVDAHRPSRPDDDPNEVHFPDVASIPGWRTEWNVTNFIVNWVLQLEERGEGYETTQLTGWARDR